MSTSHFPYHTTGFFSSLICDLVACNPRLAGYINHFPELDNFATQIDQKKGHFSQESRAALTASLHQQYKGISLSTSVAENLQHLEDENTFTVTTGHQLNLFTGPIYFIYKIISTINLCQQLSERYPHYHFVPVYWMATEDHDFEEISFFHLKGKKIKWSHPSKGAVGRLALTDLLPLLSIVKQEIGESKLAKQLKTLIDLSYGSSSTLAEATRKLVHELFKDNGLIIIDADQAKLKQLFIPHIQQELTQQKCHQTVSKTIQSLQETYSSAYTPQVNPRDINLFYLKNNSRDRLTRTNNGFVTVDTKQFFTPEEMLKEVEKHPERFSPNVLMRPLYQEVILPNLCYIGGGGEVGYWLELKSYFDDQNVPFPLLLLRNSAVLVSQKTTKKMELLGLQKEDMFLNRTALINKKIRQISNIDLDLQFLKNQLEEQFTFLEELVKKTDSSFEGSVKAQRQKQFKGIDTLEKRLLKAQKRKLADHVTRMTDLHHLIFPNEQLQERHLNFFEYYLAYGDSLIPTLREELNPMKPEFSWIELP